MTHVVILPYFCDEEVDRFVRIVRRMGEFPESRCQWQFLLAASPRIKPSQRLIRTCQRIAPTTSFRCPSQVFGYPQGPTAMFWDCMDYLHEHFPGDGGFNLWLESDMAPVKADWIDRLDAEWQTHTDPWLMGCYVPKVYKSRLFRRRKLLLDDHVNGGACYARHFARLMPASAREGVFDVAVYAPARDQGKIVFTDQIDFSTNQRVRRDVLNPGKVLLHGFMQNKDRFVADCLAPVTDQERRIARINPLLDSLESTRRKIRVWMVRRGHQAMYENMLLAKRRAGHSRRAA